MIKIYGITNCNSMKKAFDFLESKNIEYEFVDFKKAIISKDFIDSLISKVGLETLINKKGTTYKKMQGTFNEEKDKASLIAQNLSMIKRPLVIIDVKKDGDSMVCVGLGQLLQLNIDLTKL